MPLRMWVVETDHLGATDSKFYIDDPVHIPRIGEFIDGDFAGGWVSHVQWNFPKSPAKNESPSYPKAIYHTVYVYLKEKKND
jgi:hypothetical protein